MLLREVAMASSRQSVVVRRVPCSAMAAGQTKMIGARGKGEDALVRGQGPSLSKLNYLLENDSFVFYSCTFHAFIQFLLH